MFGKNELQPLVKSAGSKLQVQEIFYTIQGEGPDTGTPAMFVRLWGCHLKCFFCDTDFESNQQSMTWTDIVKLCAGPRLVVLTGGEPMRQNILPLIQSLIEHRHRVQIETAGSFWFQDVPFWRGDRLSIVCSPKTHSVHSMIALHAQAFKYVISADSGEDLIDGLPIVNFQTPGGEARRLARPPWLRERPHDIFVSPMDEQDPEKNRANVAKCVRLAKLFGYRISLQTHKIIGVP